MILIQICALILAITFVKTEDDKKWVWGSNARSGKNEKTPKKLQERYEIYENDYDEFDSQQHGFGNYGSQPGSYMGGPTGAASVNQNPFGPNKQSFPIQRPGGVYSQGGQGSPLGGRPVGGQGPFLGQGLYGQGGYGGQQGGYGQVGPSGPYSGNYGGSGGGLGPDNFNHGSPRFKQFDTCKCTEKFNCRSPAVSYGHCDVAKSYCCYNKHGGLHLSAPPSRPIHSPENGVLVGPGGPTGIVGHPGGNLGHIGAGGGAGFVHGRPGRPSFGAGFGGLGGGGGGYGSNNGVLVGPGGHNQRPGLIGLGPNHRPENGVLVGPGGPYDGPAGFGFGHKPPFARSVKQKDIEEDEKDKS